jgi:AbrB family looped-hinge helix DNA binding protein
MSVVTFRVSDRGQMALPADTRRRWNLADGGAVDIADLGDALVIVPSGHGGLRAMLLDAIDAAGGYASLADRVSRDEPDLR